LISMRERVHFLGGQFLIHSAPGEGTRLELQVPLRRNANLAGIDPAATSRHGITTTPELH